MRSILNAIKTSLPGRVSDIKDIAIIPDPQFIPDEVRYPFVGLKDGDIRSDGTLDPITTYYVHLYNYVEILKPEQSIIGGGWGGPIGVLDLAENVLAALEELGNLSIQSIINWGKDPNQLASEIGWVGGSYTQRKRVTFWYRKNE